MPIITDDMRDIIRRAILSFVATVNEDNTPNLSPKASLMAREDELFFANMASPQTVANLKRNPAIEINVVDIFSRRGYRFKGQAEVLSEGSPDFSLVAEWVWGVNGREYPVHDVVRIKVSEAKQVLSPAYVFGTGITEAELRAAYMPKYGVKDAKA
jgi:uncharacterized protein